MGDYNLSASHPAGMSGYGSGNLGTSFPRQAISSLTQTSWGSGITWDSVNSRVNILTVGTMYVLVHGSCNVRCAGGNFTICLAIYKNGVKISTGILSQFLGSGTAANPYPVTIAWEGSVVNSDNLQLYLTPQSGSSGNIPVTSITDVVLSVHAAGGSGVTYLTTLNSCNPQWSIAGITANSPTTLSTTEVSALTYLTTRTASSVDAITITPPFNILKLGVYSIYVNLQFKAIAAGGVQIITIRLKIDGVTIITRLVTLENNINASLGGTIYYFYTLSSGTQTVDVTVQSSVVNNYLIASGSSVSIKLIRRNV